MSNKLRWFTHDHDAHDDVWIRNIIRKQGHVAGWLWWVILELHHKHGVGDTLKINISDIAKAGLTSNSVVNRVLTELATEFQGQLKVRLNRVGTELELEIPKFRERQANLKFKTISKPFQNHFKTTLEREREGERERERTIEPSAKKELTPIQRVVNSYKVTKGIDIQNKAWDRANYGRYSRAAKSLIECLGGWQPAAVYVIGKGQEFTDKGLDWTLETIARHAWDNQGGLNGRAQEAVGADRVLECGGHSETPRTGKQIGSAKEILGGGSLVHPRTDGGEVQS